MVKLTPELINQSAQYINPVRDRELDLRGYKIPIIENLGATLDQFDTIDFSDNDIRKLDGFPLLKRLKTLLLNNNRVVRIGESLEECLPNLETVILTNNLVQDLNDIDPLASVKTLHHLSLLKNPIINRRHYRQYLIYRLPQLRVLDFKKIRLKEREEATLLFKSKKGKLLEKEIVRKAKTFVPGGELPDTSKPKGPSPAEIQAIKEAIAKASSLEEIEQLNQLLKTGQVPAKEQRSKSSASTSKASVEDMEVSSSWVNGK